MVEAEIGKVAMANESSAIVQKLWNYCNVLRDDGVKREEVPQ